jgi:hypothetical protein
MDCILASINHSISTNKKKVKSQKKSGVFLFGFGVDSGFTQCRKKNRSMSVMYFISEVFGLLFGGYKKHGYLFVVLTTSVSFHLGKQHI